MISKKCKICKLHGRRVWPSFRKNLLGSWQVKNYQTHCFDRGNFYYWWYENEDLHIDANSYQELEIELKKHNIL